MMRLSPLMAVNENVLAQMGQDSDMLSPLHRAALSVMTGPIQTAAEMAMQHSMAMLPPAPMSAAQAAYDMSLRAAFPALDEPIEE